MRSIKKIDQGMPSDFSKEELDSYSEKYAHMIAQDFAQGKPRIVFICENCTEGMSYNFLSFAKKDESFVKEWSRYRKTDTFSINRKFFYSASVKRADREMIFSQYERTAD